MCVRLRKRSARKGHCVSIQPRGENVFSLRWKNGPMSQRNLKTSFMRRTRPRHAAESGGVTGHRKGRSPRPPQGLVATAAERDDLNGSSEGPAAPHQFPGERLSVTAGPSGRSPRAPTGSLIQDADGPDFAVWSKGWPAPLPLPRRLLLHHQRRTAVGTRRLVAVASEALDTVGVLAAALDAAAGVDCACRPGSRDRAQPRNLCRKGTSGASSSEPSESAVCNAVAPGTRIHGEKSAMTGMDFFAA